MASSHYHCCYGCKDRTIVPVNCHSVCKRYLAEQAEAKAEDKKEKEQRRITGLTNRILADGQRRRTHSGRKR